jgi:hypothetical protein
MATERMGGDQERLSDGGGTGQRANWFLPRLSDGYGRSVSGRNPSALAAVVSTEFSIDLTWFSTNHGPVEVRETSAFLSLGFGDRSATRVEDDWSKSVRTQVRISAYPLALWFASSWWRLRWEVKPSKGAPPLLWRMAHQMAAAESGFLWPDITFASDGENLEVVCHSSEPELKEPVRYLSDFRTSVAAESFESTVDRFVSLVLARLDATGTPKSQLRDLWDEILEERRDPTMSQYRRWEATLGFEPDEAPAALLDDVRRLGLEAGLDATRQIAYAGIGGDPTSFLQEVKRLSATEGIDGEVAVPPQLREELIASGTIRALPWERGRIAARQSRAAWSIPAGPVSNDGLAQLLQLPRSAFSGKTLIRNGSPLGLAIRDDRHNGLKFMFRKSNETSRRFEAARFLADHLLAPPDDRWLPSTDAKTSRQKAQRAFAAEFLCPIDELKAFLGDNFSSESSEDAAERFQVSSLAVESQLANNGLIAPS